MVNRGDIGKRVRAKSLQKLIAKKKETPEKYMHETSEYSTYLGLKWDYEHKQINPGKMDMYKELQTKYGEKK